MKKVSLHDKNFVPYLSNDRIETAIDGVAGRLNADFENSTEVPVLLCVLNGAIMFTAELMKRLNFPLELMSMKLSSYEGTQSTGVVKEISSITGSVEGKTVIICEDIVDTGTTIVALKEKLASLGAKEIRVCTMLVKPAVLNNRVKLDYVGMEIPNDFIVGFGLDYNELGRNLKDIYVIEK